MSPPRRTAAGSFARVIAFAGVTSIGIAPGCARVTGTVRENASGARSTSAMTFVQLPAGDAGTRWPGAIALGPDGKVWFTELHGRRIGRINASGHVDEFVLADALAKPGAIVSGPGAALTFSIPNRHRLGRLTTDGKFSFASLRATDGRDIRPIALAVTADRNIWFTEPFAHRVGRLEPNGRVREFSLPDRSWVPIQITNGPDGALWFTARDGKIGRITLTGAVRRFDVPGSRGTDLFGIVTGADHNVWFTATNRRRIGRLAASGALAEFAVPRGYPGAIAAGRNGDLWFTTIVPSTISRVTRAGRITQFDLPTGFDKPGGIVAGADGALWFTVYTNDMIGRLPP